VIDAGRQSAIPVSPDEAFEAVSNSRRRQVILSLARTDDYVSVSDLAVELAAIENTIDPSEVTGEERTRVYISLIQTHLDTLDDLGIVEYDDRAKQVKSTDATQPLAEYAQALTTACYKPSEEGEA